MISIEEAIEESKKKENVSNGGSDCFDFGDVVLVKYSIELQYLQSGQHSRDSAERVMEGVNTKADQGASIPRHLAIKRVVEGNMENCYVLQEKAKGTNCQEFFKYVDTFEEKIASLEWVRDIPYEYYSKLMRDCCSVYEMFFEPKLKNLFYDENTGFWLIDFLDYDKEKSFDPNNLEMVNDVVNHGYVFHLSNLAARLDYDVSLTPEQQEQIEALDNQIMGKEIMAYKENIPIFEKYEKLLLCSKSDSLKRYLMEQGIVKKDLFKMEEEDYAIFDEQYGCVVDKIIESIDNGDDFAAILDSKIKMVMGTVNLNNLWLLHKSNPIDKSVFGENYEPASESFLNIKILMSIAEKMRTLEKNENRNVFLSTYELWCSKNKIVEKIQAIENDGVLTSEAEDRIEASKSDDNKHI